MGQQTLASTRVHSWIFRTVAILTMGFFLVIPWVRSEDEGNEVHAGVLLDRRLAAVEEQTKILAANQKKISDQQAAIDKELDNLRIWINRRR